MAVTTPKLIVLNCGDLSLEAWIDTRTMPETAQRALAKTALALGAEAACLNAGWMASVPNGSVLSADDSRAFRALKAEGLIRKFEDFSARGMCKKNLVLWVADTSTDQEVTDTLPQPPKRGRSV